MARVKYGSLITEIKGKIGGHVLQEGFGAKILRTKTNVSHFRNQVISDQNAMYQFLSYKWGLLSANELTSWYDKKSLYPFEDPFGDEFIGTAFNVFVFLNSGLYLIDEDIITECPDPEPLPKLIEASLTIDLSDLQCDFDFSPSPVPADYGIIIRWFKRKKSTKAELKDLDAQGRTFLTPGELTPDSLYDVIKNSDPFYWQQCSPDDLVPVDYQQVLISTGQRTARTKIYGTVTA